MISYLKTHIAYVALGFSAVLLTVIGILIYQKSDGLSQQPSKQTPEISPGAQSAEIAFSLNNGDVPPSCDRLTATPEEASSPASISFEAIITAQQGDNLDMSFDYGDGKQQTVNRLVTNPQGQETQISNHTYTTAGLFSVSLTITKSSQPDIKTVCQTQVTISGSSVTLPTAVVSGNPIPTALAQKSISATPTIVKTISTPTIKLSPTRIPTVTKTGATVYPTTVEDTTIPVPQVPEAGGFLPTVVAALAGITIVILAFAL